MKVETRGLFQAVWNCAQTWPRVSVLRSPQVNGKAIETAARLLREPRRGIQLV